MDDTSTYDKIDAFWDWFGANDEYIRETLLGHSDQEKEALVQTLNNFILAIGMFTWELGHGKSKPFYLTISPNNSRELLELSRDIMESAPYLPDWELHHAKPAQVWDLKFRIYDEDYNEWDVDASKWKFVLREHPGEGVLVVVEAANISYLDAETTRTAVEQVVTGLLGEEQKIEHVRKIEIRNQLSASSTPITALKQRFEAFIY